MLDLQTPVRVSPVLSRWREAVAARKKLRRQMRAFPAAPCCLHGNDQLRAVAPSAECPIAEENLAKGLLDLGHAGKVGVSCTRSALSLPIGLKAPLPPGSVESTVSLCV